ncbi:uncharacterized protein LOC116428810 [Nomia melanderi]|uniref:uncharacterized protein LOC116428810 n=1 Tax=Nomia melanderi TaxID=2448451 RepID=UPI0013041FE1|nr:uncharacterized protein LOC116428810 [Nomia melanderi]
MKISEKGWRTVCAVLCVTLASTNAYTVYVINPKAYNPETINPKQTYLEVEDLTRVTDYQPHLIPIKSPRVIKGLVTLPLEPEAEMLPAHYIGVKPPGVDHMELKYAESQLTKTKPNQQPSRNRKQHERAGQATLNRSNVQLAQQGRQKTASRESGRKGDHQKEKQRTDKVESGGKKKSHSKEDGSSNYEEAKTGGRTGSSHQKKKGDYVDSKAGGYHNVYHKDEFKKDHDFYDNDDEGGHLKKHGQYKEKHTAYEGSYKKGASKNSGSGESEAGKKGTSENSQAEQESEGHVASSEYDGFFKNFQGFAKQTGQGKGEKFDFAEMKGR